MTYVEAISEFQKRSINALKVAQSTQIASLRATRDYAAAFVAPPMALWIACSKSFADTLAIPVRALTPTAPEPPQHAGSMPAPAVPTPATEAVTPARPVDVAYVAPAVEVADSAPAVEAADIAPAIEVADVAPAVEVADSAPAVEVADSAPAVKAQPAKAPVAAEPVTKKLKVTAKKTKPGPPSNDRVRSKRGPGK